MKIVETTQKADWPAIISRVTGAALLVAGVLLAAGLCAASPRSDNPAPNIFDPHSTPAESIRDHSYFVLAITGLIFLVVVSLLVYALVKFRDKPLTAGREPAQVYGSTQIELAS
jgi:heme/copper-type cytochrome/quinol oxidase subunit 2